MIFNMFKKKVDIKEEIELFLFKIDRMTKMHSQLLAYDRDALVKSVIAHGEDPEEFLEMFDAINNEADTMKELARYAQRLHELVPLLGQEPQSDEAKFYRTKVIEEFDSLRDKTTKGKDTLEELLGLVMHLDGCPGNH